MASSQQLPSNNNGDSRLKGLPPKQKSFADMVAESIKSPTGQQQPASPSPHQQQQRDGNNRASNSKDDGNKTIVQKAVPFIGSVVTVVFRDGSKIDGLLLSADAGLLKLNNNNKKEFSVEINKVNDIYRSIKNSNSRSNANNRPHEQIQAMAGFKTDTEISAIKIHPSFSPSSQDGMKNERDLQKWQAENTIDRSKDFDFAQESAKLDRNWDQFAENERLFGLKSDFQEDEYTVPVNAGNHTPEILEQRRKEAERLAQEILKTGSPVLTSHVAEERGFIESTEDGDDWDEEARYGAVLREPQRPKDYKPPASSLTNNQPGQAGRRKSIVELASEDMTSVIDSIIRSKQQQQQQQQSPTFSSSSLNPDASEFNPFGESQASAPPPVPAYNPYYSSPYGLNPYLLSNPYAMYDPYVATQIYQQYYTMAAASGMNPYYQQAASGQPFYPPQAPPAATFPPPTSNNNNNFQRQQEDSGQDTGKDKAKNSGG